MAKKKRQTGKSKKTKDSRAEASRAVSSGDTSPRAGEDRIRDFEVNEAIESARGAKITAVQDIIGTSPPYDIKTLASVLHAIMDGTSTDDAAVLRKALLRQPQRSSNGRSKPDDMLATDWQDGEYPYKNLMSRKNYEKEKYKLQVELLKLQAWVRETGQKVVVLFEGRDAAGKGGSIKRFMEHLNPRGARVVALEKPSAAEQGQW